MRIGVIGGGQLGRMLAIAAAPIGLSTVHLDPATDACAGQVAPLLVGRYDDPALLAELARECDVVTVELEQVPLAAFGHLGERPLRPSRRSVETTQDRLLEKQLCIELGIPTAQFVAIDSTTLLDAAAAQLGLPLLLKTRRGGYDGKGQQLVREREQLLPAWEALGRVPLIAEAFVAFEREISVVSVRSEQGEVRCYPLVENTHAEGILRVSRALPADPALLAQAESIAAGILEQLGHVGVLAVELFDAGGSLLVNEIAPRVHNSGHWTIEGAETSQFENHLRAVAGLPLGSTQPTIPSAMVNLIGSVPATADVLAVPGARLHLYGKQPRPGRKLGHVTVIAPDERVLEQRVEAVLALTAAAAPALLDR